MNLSFFFFEFSILFSGIFELKNKAINITLNFFHSLIEKVFFFLSENSGKLSGISIVLCG
jgi:hypothetical protein